MARSQQIGAVTGLVGLLTCSGVDLASAADLTAASAMLTSLLGSANSWASIILVAMIAVGLIVVSMTHFADLRQVLSVPMVLAIVAALVVASPQIVAGVGLAAGATLHEVVVTTVEGR